MRDVEFGRGVALKLRPGFNKFMETISKYYEIVVFTDESTNQV